MGYDNDEVDQSHGTHVAGIAAAKKVGDSSSRCRKYLFMGW